MKDLIEILAARATGLEVALTPSVGSLYDPNSGTGLEQFRLDEILTEVVAPQLGPPAWRSVPAPVRGRAWPRADVATQAASTPPAPASAEPNSLKASYPGAASRLVSRTDEDSSPEAGKALEPGSTASLREPAVSATSPSTADSAVGRMVSIPKPASSRAKPAGQRASSPSAFESSTPGRAVAAGPARRDQNVPRPGTFGEQPPPARAAAFDSGGDNSSTAAAGNRMEAVGETVVNVTIGRVELRAVRQAAPAKPTEVSASRPFPSLDEYLQRTSEGRA